MLRLESRWVSLRPSPDASCPTHSRRELFDFAELGAVNRQRPTAAPARYSPRAITLPSARKKIHAPSRRPRSSRSPVLGANHLGSDPGGRAGKRVRPSSWPSSRALVNYRRSWHRADEDGPRVAMGETARSGHLVPLAPAAVHSSDGRNGNAVGSGDRGRSGWTPPRSEIGRSRRCGFAALFRHAARPPPSPAFSSFQRSMRRRSLRPYRHRVRCL